jgi:pimeloyl-ACP methyl ester carboxylesterase
MPTAVLIHGAFHGGWCWDKVRPRLQEDGWAVYAPSLTGLGDRAHLASRRISLRTHVRDVVGLIETENVTDVILCGHSAAGMVITGVADAIAERLHTLVYLDAIIPGDGESIFDIVGHDNPMTVAFKREAAERGQGWLVPPGYSRAADFGVTDPADAAWLEQNLTAHPISAFADPLPSTSGLGRVANKVYVRCVEAKNRPHFDRALISVSGRPGWTVHRWPSAHNVMITEPERVLELFASVASL